MEAVGAALLAHVLRVEIRRHRARVDVEDAVPLLVGVVLGTLLASVLVIWVGATRYFETGSRYVTYFDESVQGLQKDSPVKYRGVEVGRVEQIRVAPDNHLIEVLVKIDLAEGVRNNVVAELKAVGINLDFAPVCDVNVNPNNPVIGVRSFGDAPDRVTAYARAAYLGLRAAGVLSCAKHFPGHGDTETDSHSSLPVLNFGKKRLEAIELVPFRNAVKCGVKSVMTAHVHLSQFDSDDKLPASLCEPKLFLRHKTAGRSARSAALLVGSMPGVVTNAQNAGSTFNSCRQVRTVFAQGVFSSLPMA